MGFFDWFSRKEKPQNASLENPSTSVSEFMDFLTDGSGNSTGVRVTEQTAMKSVVAWRCVNLIAGTIAGLPLQVMKEDSGGFPQANRNHDMYKQFAKQPNALMSAFLWIETMLVHLLLWGNHYTEMKRR